MVFQTSKIFQKPLGKNKLKARFYSHGLNSFCGNDLQESFFYFRLWPLGVTAVNKLSDFRILFSQYTNATLPYKSKST